MSEKQQHNAEMTREAMLHRYDDGLHHKHNKCRMPYRKHWRSHPAQLSNGHDQKKELNGSFGVEEQTVYQKTLKKTRLRIVKHLIH